MAKYKIVIPKAGATNELGTETKLYVLDEIVDAKESWQKEMMGAFSANGWAIEVKMESTSDVEESKSRCPGREGRSRTC